MSLLSWPCSVRRQEQARTVLPGQSGQELGTAAGCEQQVSGRWGGKEGGKRLGEDWSDKGKVWMC